MRRMGTEPAPVLEGPHSPRPACSLGLLSLTLSDEWKWGAEQAEPGSLCPNTWGRHLAWCQA